MESPKLKLAIGALLATLSLVLAIVLFQSNFRYESNNDKKISQLDDRLIELEALMAAHVKRIEAIETTLLSQSAAPITPHKAADRSRGEKTNVSSTETITVKVSNKRFQASDTDLGRFNDFVWYDAMFSSQLKKRTRSIKGVMQFCDLFGEPRFQIRVTLDDPIEPGSEITTAGIGFEYNQFIDSHNWMRTTDLSDMTFKFQPQAILYADGTRE